MQCYVQVLAEMVLCIALCRIVDNVVEDRHWVIGDWVGCVVAGLHTIGCSICISLGICVGMRHCVIVLGMLAIGRNKEKLMRWCYYSLFVFGILPCAMGMGGQFPEMLAYVRDPSNAETPTVKGTFPMVIIWYIFFLIAIQIHACSMYCAYYLVAAWQPVVTTTSSSTIQQSTSAADKKTE